MTKFQENEDGSSSGVVEIQLPHTELRITSNISDDDVVVSSNGFHKPQEIHHRSIIPNTKQMQCVQSVITTESLFYSGLFVAIFYGFCSGAMAFLNKAIMSTFDFRCPNLIVLGQMILLSTLLEILRRCQCLEVSDYTFQRAKTVMVASISYLLNSTFALLALGSMNIPMYNVLKRCVPLVNLCLSLTVLEKKCRPSGNVMFSVLIITVGTIVAGFGDLSFSLSSYTYGVISVFAQALYLTCVQKIGTEHNLSTVSILYINSINCVPLALAGSVISGEFRQAASYDGFWSIGFGFALLLEIVCGCVLNYSLFLCTNCTSALTTSFVGAIKGILTTFIGFFTFGGVVPNAVNILGMSINTCGGLWYTFAKYRDSVRRRNHPHGEC